MQGPEYWLTVSSSHIHQIGWHPRMGGQLWVRFLGGTVVYYSPAPRELFDGMRFATSKGKFLDARVKKAGIPFEYVA